MLYIRRMPTPLPHSVAPMKAQTGAEGGEGGEGSERGERGGGGEQRGPGNYKSYILALKEKVGVGPMTPSSRSKVNLLKVRGRGVLGLLGLAFWRGLGVSDR